MKKYKMELALVSIFLAILTGLMWNFLSHFWKFLPAVLLVFFLFGCLSTLLPFGKKTADRHEKYSPIFYAKTLVSSLLGVGIIFTCAVLLNKKNFSATYDLTTNHINSLSSASTKYLSSLKTDVQIFCVGSPNPTDDYCSQSQDLINLYAHYSTHIQNLGPVSLTDRDLLHKIQPSGFSRLVLFTKDNKSEIDGKISESNLTNALVNLIQVKKVVYFLQGNGEPILEPSATTPRTYADIVDELKSKAYTVKSWNVRKGALPKDARVIVAGDNLSPYSTTTETMLTNFVGRGGKLVLMMNPYRDGGLKTFYSKMGLKPEETLLTMDMNSPLGEQIAKQNLARPPVVASDFSASNSITKVFTQMYGRQSVMLLDGARPLFVLEKNPVAGLNLDHETILSSYAAAPISLSDAQRNQIDVNGPLLLKPDHHFDGTKPWPLAVDVKITNSEKLLTDPKLKPLDNEKNQGEVIVYGFGLVSAFSKNAPSTEELLPLTVAHLYADRELISIPPRDFKPKNFNLARNPGAFVLLFAAILPMLTAATGAFVWMRRRAA